MLLDTSFRLYQISFTVAGRKGAALGYCEADKMEEIKKMRKCILIKTNLEFEVVELPEDDTFYDEVYKLLDCECWEGVPGAFGTYLMVDESGKLKRPPKKENLLACSLYAGFIFGEDVLVGDVLVSTIGKNEDGESDLVSLSDKQIVRVMRTLELEKNRFVCGGDIKCN